MSIPTKIKFTGNQTLTNLHVSGSVDIMPRKLNVDTIKTEIKFCITEVYLSVINLVDTISKTASKSF